MRGVGSSAVIPETGASMRTRAVDAIRRVAHLSHEARMLKSIAQDAAQDAAYHVRRAVKTTRRNTDEMRLEVAHRIRQQPLRAVGTAFGAGLLLGALTGLTVALAGRPSRDADV